MIRRNDARDLDADEFSPEQLVTIAVLQVTGCAQPEAVARAGRVAAYLVGAHLAPVLEGLAAAWVDSLQAFRAIDPAPAVRHRRRSA